MSFNDQAAAAQEARAAGRKGGKARAERLTPEQRAEAARMAARQRWEKRSGSGN